MIEQPPIATESRLRRAYGFEEVALVPGAVTADPAEVELATDLAGIRSALRDGRLDEASHVPPSSEHVRIHQRIRGAFEEDVETVDA